MYKLKQGSDTGNAVGVTRLGVDMHQKGMQLTLDIKAVRLRVVWCLSDAYTPWTILIDMNRLSPRRSSRIGHFDSLHVAGRWIDG